jgi:hypothetical protein
MFVLPVLYSYITPARLVSPDKADELVEDS